MPDKVEVRPFQQELMNTTIARISALERITVGWVGAGSGKTYAWLMTVNEAFRQGLIDGVATLVPRVGLKIQAELDCIDYRDRCGLPVMGEIIARENVAPLVPRDKFGYATTYQAVVSDARLALDKQLHLSWAKEHAGRFILVLDEAQFVGLLDEDGGTKASEVVEELSRYALHTIVLTATPTRSDGRALALATYAEPDERGIRNLQWHVRATYTDGVSLGYLRPCIFELNNGEGIFSDQSEFTLAELEGRLSTVLRSLEVWQPIVDQAVGQFIERRKLSEEYRCLIAAIDQTHAKAIWEYLKRSYPGFLSVLAISNHDDAHDVMTGFRPKDKGGKACGDILVTVAMAYIGFDCPTISVVGVLTNRRWAGWLEQLIMRGGRVWKGRPLDEQYMVVVGPNDPFMRRFAERFRADSETGLRERKQGNGSNPPEPSDVTVETATITDQVYMGLSIDQDVSPEEANGLREFKKKLTSNVEVTVLAEIFRKGGFDIPRMSTPEQKMQETYTQRRTRWGHDVQDLLAAVVRSRYSVDYDKDPERHVQMKKDLTNNLNRQQNVKNSDFLTDDQWEERKRILRKMLRRDET